VTNSTTPGTHKPINDTQQFVVEKPIFTVQVKAENLNNEPVSQILIDAHNETAMVERKTANATGVATFLLEMDNYTFKALLNSVEVGVIYNSSIIENKTGNKALTLTCQLTNIKMLVIDSAGNPMPFISLAANHTYATEPLSFTTNYTGIWNLRSTFTNISYEIEASRFGHIFNQTYIERMPIAPWFNITITLPTHTASIHVADSKNDAAEGVKVEAFEWTMGVGQPDQSSTTNSDGDVSFILTFGKYRIRVYKGDILLNETTIDLIQNQSFTLHLAILNVDLEVAAIDYFGQPIPNALVKIEQRITTESMEDNTGPDGSVTFSNILGGDSRISIYIRGQLGETRELYLANSKQVVLHLNRYIVIAGYALETSQFVTIISIALLIVAFILGLTYKRLPRFFKKRK
jgi:hypothetical protein